MFLAEITGHCRRGAERECIRHVATSAPPRAAELTSLGTPACLPRCFRQSACGPPVIGEAQGPSSTGIRGASSPGPDPGRKAGVWQGRRRRVHTGTVGELWGALSWLTSRGGAGRPQWRSGHCQARRTGAASGVAH